MLISFDLEVGVVVVEEVPRGDWLVVEHFDLDCVARVSSPVGRGLATCERCQQKEDKAKYLHNNRLLINNLSNCTVNHFSIYKFKMSQSMTFDNNKIIFKPIVISHQGTLYAKNQFLNNCNS